MPMPVLTTPSTEQRATGLGGAIGCSFRQAHNDLIFVEFAGRLSRLSLVRPVAATVSSGTATLRGTWLFDFDAGHEGTTGDVWWEQHTATRRSLEASGGARIVNLGHVNFANVTPALLQTLTYGTNGINGNNDATNLLTPGDVFAVRTNLGNYAKVQVVSYGYDLHLTWTTYRLAFRLPGDRHRLQPARGRRRDGRRDARVRDRAKRQPAPRRPLERQSRRRGGRPRRDDGTAPDLARRGAQRRPRGRVREPGAPASDQPRQRSGDHGGARSHESDRAHRHERLRVRLRDGAARGRPRQAEPDRALDGTARDPVHRLRRAALLPALVRSRRGVVPRHRTRSERRDLARRPDARAGPDLEAGRGDAVPALERRRRRGERPPRLLRQRDRRDQTGRELHLPGVGRHHAGHRPRAGDRNRRGLRDDRPRLLLPGEGLAVRRIAAGDGQPRPRLCRGRSVLQGVHRRRRAATAVQRLSLGQPDEQVRAPYRHAERDRVLRGQEPGGALVQPLPRLLRRQHGADERAPHDRDPALLRGERGVGDRQPDRPGADCDAEDRQSLADGGDQLDPPRRGGRRHLRGRHLGKLEVLVRRHRERPGRAPEELVPRRDVG